MKRIKLTERELSRIVRRVIKENNTELDEFFFEKEDENSKMDKFIEEVKEALRDSKVNWDFFSRPKPVSLNSLIEKVRDICDKYE